MRRPRLKRPSHKAKTREERAILLLGAGHMGSALLGGWLRVGHMGPIIVVEPNPSPSVARHAKAGNIVLLKRLDAAKLPKLRAVVIALKPQIIDADGPLLRPLGRLEALVVSIAAGTTIRRLRSFLGPQARVIRAMPNTPGAVGRGITALYAPKDAAVADRRLAQRLTEGLGETLWVAQEKLIDAVTAVSGSGPAYVFLLVEALARSAEAEGLPREAAMRLARATITGAGALLTHDNRAAKALREAVTSPRGTTEAALRILLAKDGMESLIRRAVRAATLRGRELGR